MQTAQAQRKFLHDIAWVNSWGAALARNSTYASDSEIRDRDKQALRQRAHRLVVDLSQRYMAPVCASEHEANIQELSQALSREFARVLGPHGFKIGTSQKLLNLYLKFLWCLGEIPEPPHCPLDRIIQSKAKIQNVVPWSGITTIDGYRDAMGGLREAVDRLGHNDKSLAQWEVEAYGSESPASIQVQNS